MSISPLENKPEVLERIGLFVVLFGLIDLRLGLEFYFIVSQQNAEHAPVLDFLSSQDFSMKVKTLKSILGGTLYKELIEINKFRNFVVHGQFGMNSLDEISLTKQKRNTREYDSMKIDIKTLNNYIKREKQVLQSLHERSKKSGE